MPELGALDDERKFGGPGMFEASGLSDFMSRDRVFLEEFDFGIVEGCDVAD